MEPQIFLGPSVTLFVGLFAFVVYFMKKRADRASAAMVITMDVRDNERLISSFMSGDPGQLSAGRHIRFANWENSKHLFTTRLSQDEFEAFNRFFQISADVATAAKDHSAVVLTNLQAKATAVQQGLCNINKEDEGYKEERDKLLKKIGAEDFMFTPNEPLFRLGRSLTGFDRVSTSTGFAKLKRLAGMSDERLIRFFG
jgi:hypothetical protein